MSNLFSFARRRNLLMRKKSRGKLTAEEKLEYAELNRTLDEMGQYIPTKIRDGSLPDRAALERAYEIVEGES